jgi:Tfp pilus assembly protein PilO
MRLKATAEQLWAGHRRSLLLLLVLLVLNLLLLTALQQWWGPRLDEREARFRKRQAEVRALLKGQGEIARSPAQLFALGSQDLSRFRQAIPPYAEFSGLIEELLVLSSRARLEIDQISYRSEMLKDTPLLQYRLDFNVSGRYEQLKRFIHALEQSRRLLVIRQISLQESDAEGVSLRLSIESYFRPGGRES